MDHPDSHVHVVILAGGVGSRFWPASTPTRPKQLLALGSHRPLIVDTVARALEFVPVERLHILTTDRLRQAFQRVLPALPDSGYWIEPRARGTGPVLAWAAHRLARLDPEAVMISLHADHTIRPTEAMVEVLRHATELARRSQHLVTIAIGPDRPETGYGWIRPGSAIETDPGDPEAFHVAEFREKPDHPTAVRYLERGYYWNSGIFVWGVRTFLEEVRTSSPEIGPHLEHLDEADVAGFFDAVGRISVDEAVLERSDRVAAVEATFEWDDVGSWTSLARARPPDPLGNSAHGQLTAVDANRNLVWSDEGPTILWGVDDLIVVRSNGVTVVAPRERGADWKELLDRIPDNVRAAADRTRED